MARIIPNISNKFVCIVDYKRQDLAAVISSYIAEVGQYPLLFEFPAVTSFEFERRSEDVDEHTPSMIRASEFRIFVNNMLVRVSAENLIIAGLSEEQKSYLDFLEHFNVIEINSIEEVDFHLGAFIHGKGTIYCRPDDVLKGLYASLKSNSLLQLKEDAPDIDLIREGNRGLVVIEKEKFAGTIIAINYAFSIEADIEFVESVSNDEQLSILDKFAEYGSGIVNAGDEIKAFVNDRTKHFNYNNVEFVTYFTIGIPYTFATANSLPATYVNCHLRPDFFIVNNLLFYGKLRFGGAIAFSPEFFEVEESNQVSQLLSNQSYFVKELFGEKADILNFDMNVKLFPFDIFHICSHGGEIEGCTVEQEFTDRDGVKHTIVYDQVLSFSPSLRPGLVHVQSKTYFKVFDGMIWRSPELKAKDIPQYVFADMQNAMRVTKAKDKKVGPKKKVSNSSGIQCSDGPHLSLFSTIASQSSPFIFNNTCWSWFNAAEAFIVGGANSYIGTFWNVRNQQAVDFAIAFYKSAFTMPIMDALHEAVQGIRGTPSEDIYMVWGLHFSRLYQANSAEKSRGQVFDELMRSFGGWQYNLRTATLESTRDSIGDYLFWIYKERKQTFSEKDFQLFKDKLEKMIIEKKTKGNEGLST